ncbi:MAG TPA: metallophosphoesterase family protein [Chloroflexia bacterium]|nr:metallophosphoesterase family protein [Chloroflexia bacterium]
MKVAIISDMHGNCFALDAVLADLERHPSDAIVCLGDAVQGGAQPAETIARLRDLDCPIVMGNADAWLLTSEETGREETTQRMLEIREWSLSQLSAENRAFIASFQPTVEMLLGEYKLLCFHGSPASFDVIILPETPEEEFQRYLGEHQPAIMTGGHTHLQFVRRLGNTFFFNPGSVGFAYNRHQPEEGFKADPWAEYAILSSEDGRISLEFRRVPFAVDALVSIILSSGRPYADAMAAQYR